MTVEKQLLEDVNTIPTSNPALPSCCGIAMALRSSGWHRKEQSCCVVHIRSMANGFAIFMDFVF